MRWRFRLNAATKSTRLLTVSLIWKWYPMNSRKYVNGLFGFLLRILCNSMNILNDLKKEKKEIWVFKLSFTFSIFFLNFWTYFWIFEQLWRFLKRILTLCGIFLRFIGKFFKNPKNSQDAIPTLRQSLSKTINNCVNPNTPISLIWLNCISPLPPRFFRFKVIFRASVGCRTMNFLSLNVFLTHTCWD